MISDTTPPTVTFHLPDAAPLRFPVAYVTYPIDFEDALTPSNPAPIPSGPEPGS